MKADIISAGFIVRHKDKYLVGQNSLKKDDEGWTIFKGCQEKDETLLETALRELQEESNIDVFRNANRTKYTKKPLFSYYLQKTKKKVFVFLLDDVKGDIYNGDVELKCNTFFGNNRPEIASYQWFSLKQLEQKLFPSQQGIIYVLKHVKDKTVGRM